MLLFLQLQGSVQIDRKLELQSVIKRCHVKRLGARLIIRDLDIDLIFLLTGVNPVDFSSIKTDFGSGLNKISHLLLTKQSPDSPVHKALHSCNQIFPPFRAVENRVFIVHDTLLHTFFYKISPHFIRDLRHGNRQYFCLSGKMLHSPVKKIPPVQRLELILLTLPQSQTVGQEVGKRTGRIPFQPRHAPVDPLLIEDLCRLL